MSSRIALIGDNSIEYISILLKIWNQGNCALLIDYHTPYESVCGILRDAGVAFCYVETGVFDNDDYRRKVSAGIFVEYISKRIYDIIKSELYASFHSDYSANEALILYSSGTTGQSKGIILSHFAINTNADSIQEYAGLSRDDCVYLVKSLAHSSTIVGELLVALKNNVRVVVGPTVVPPRIIASNIVAFSVTTIALNPTLLALLLNEISRKKYDLSKLKVVFTSGDVLDDDLYKKARFFFDQEGISFYNVYGLSEAGPRVCAQRRYCCNSNSVGRPISGVSVAIINEKGQLAAINERGTVYVYTPCGFSGYVVGGEKNKSIYHNWLNTGDYGYCDESQEIHIIGRCDDLIILDGHKIYPYDIEETIKKKCLVEDCMVFKKRIETGFCLGCLYSGKSQQGNWSVLLSDTLLQYEIPRFIRHVKRIPRNANGKKVRPVL